MGNGMYGVETLTGINYASGKQRYSHTYLAHQDFLFRSVIIVYLLFVANTSKTYFAKLRVHNLNL